jgi:NDP-sugar pyrophosphorylase family protein
LLPEKRIFSIVKAYVEIAKKDQRIFGYKNNKDFWIDLGRQEHLELAEKYLRNKSQ